MKPLRPNSALTKAANKYEKSRGLKTRNRSNSCRMFERLMGFVSVRSVTPRLLDRFSEKAERMNYSAASIKKTVCDVKTIVHSVTGRRLVLPPPPPPELQDVGDVTELPVDAWAERYCRIREVTRREPIYTANRFVRFMGRMRVSTITTKELTAFRNVCLFEGLSPRTIESNVSDLQTLIKAATGAHIEPGRRCKLNRPKPKPVLLRNLEAMWPQCDTWLQQFIVLSFWTGLRLADALRLQLSLSNTITDQLELTASKTLHFFQWPIVPWIERYLTRRTLPFRKSNDYAFKKTRSAIQDACRSANVSVWTPKQLRQFALTTWMRADPVAGQIIHGCGLNSVLKHYIDPMTILEQAAKKLDVPHFFKGTGQDNACSDPAELFERLDTSSRDVLIQTMRAMLGRTA